MADFTLRYGDWKGGDFGIRDPSKADADQFSGLNVMPYSSRLLGVRAGLKQLTITGLPGHNVVPGPAGFWARESALVVVLDKPYQFPNTGGAATAWTAYPPPAPTTPIPPIKFVVGNGVVYSLMGGKLYKHASPASTTLVTTPASFSYIVRWGYYFVAVDATTPWRLWFNEVSASGSNFDSWPANNFLDVGNTEPITALNPLFNTLFVGKRTGWNAVSGVLGTLASVRGVALGLGPVDPRQTTATTDNRILYWPVEKRPAWFNGERVNIEEEQEVEERSSPFPCDTVIVTPTARRLILANDTLPGTQVLSWHESAWTRHLFSQKLAGFVPVDVIDGAQMPADVIYTVRAPTIVGEPVVIGSFNHALGRPGHLDDQFSAPSDAGFPNLVAGSVTFPTYWEPIGRQVRLRSLIVQFRKWASGVPTANNEILVRVNALGRYGGGLELGTSSQWIEPCDRSSTDGTDDSWRVNFGEQGYGNGFQIEFQRLVGVALREVVALCDVKTERT